MQPWLVALCAIRFDVEQGQLLECAFPPNALTAAEESHVAFSAFPDTSPVQQLQQRGAQIHDSVFFFRIPRRSDGDQQQQRKGSPSFLYGYVFNRQRQDERLKRGGEQKSLVILSHLPYWCVFRPLVQIAGPLFFDSGNPALEKISASVSRWPNPKHGSFMELPVVNNMIIRANLPPFQALPPELQQQLIPILQQQQQQQHEELFSMSPRGIFHDVHLFGVLKGVLMQLWLLWELALIGEPLLILAPNPSISSQAVAAITSLIIPLPCSSDFRPYFTIHDPDLSSLLTSSSSFPSIILGVTNLYFVKSLPKFPNVLSLQGSPPTKRHQHNRLLQFLNRNSKTSAAPGFTTSQQQQLWSSHIPATKPDTSVLNRLLLDDHQPPSPRTDESMTFVNSDILCRHFVELTTNFLSPFAAYLRPTAAPGRSSSPFADPPPLPAFDQSSFLTGLAQRGPGKFLSKRLRSNWIDLYSRFLKGPNFMPWFQARRAAAEKEQQRIWRQARAKADVRALVASMSELHLVDLFHAILRHLRSELQMSSSITDKLQSDLRTVFNLLPKDMQQLLLLNPQHAALLQIQRSRSSSGSSSSRESVKVPGRPSIHISYSSEPSALSRMSSGSPLSGRLAQELASDPLDLDKI